MRELLITKGGKLILKSWASDGQDHDVSEVPFTYLTRHCEIEDGVVLKDLLTIVRPQASLLSPLLTSAPNWLHEIIDEGLNTPFKQEMAELEYLQLSWTGEIQDYSGTKEFYEYTSFNGFGPVPKNDPNYKDWPEGQPVSWALDFSPVYTLSELPLKLDRILKIYDYSNRKIGVLPSVVVEAEKEFTLLDILRGVFWELSSHGSPKDRNNRAEDLKRRIDEIDSGEAKLVDWEDVKARLKEKWGKDDEV